MNETTIQLIAAKQRYYSKMSKTCSDILEGISITESCKNNNIDLASFRNRVLRKEEPHTKFSYTQDQLIEMTKDLMTPEELIFRSVMKFETKNLHLYLDFPEDFESTVYNVLQDVCNDRQLSVMKMRYYENKSIQEIADNYQVSTSRISSMINSITQTMRRRDYIYRLILGDKQYQEYTKNTHKPYVISYISTVDGHKDENDVSVSEIRSQSISSLPLSARSLNALRRNKIKTIGDLVEISDIDMLKFKGLGHKCMCEIHQVLKEQGLLSI